MKHPPIIKPEYLVPMWFETEDGKHRVPLDFNSCNPCGAEANIDMFPIACSRSGIEIRTDVYRRRGDGGYGGNDLVCSMNSSASEDLVLALALGSNGQRKYRLREALVIAGESCECCMNVLAHQYGLKWGYEFGSEDQKKSGTSCQWCS